MDTQNIYDVAVIGGGPAGLTAALYLARAKYRVVVVEKASFGGQAATTHEVVNYPGVLKAGGAELTETMRRQAEGFGAEFLAAEVQALDMGGELAVLRTTRGELRCHGVLLATGGHPRTIGFAGEAEYRGRGIAYCATCDGEFFTGRDVYVIGGGYAAAEEAVFLTKYARQVTVLMRGADFSCAGSVAEAARSHPKVRVLPHTEVEEAAGDTLLRRIRYRNNRTGERGEFTAPAGENIGLFVFAGYQPNSALVQGLAELDAQGYVITRPNMETSVPGLFAAGDVCAKPLRQIATAVGDGALAATALERHVSARQRATGIIPVPPQPAPAEPAAQPQPAAGQGGGGLFDAATLAQLQAVFTRMERPLVLRLSLDDRPASAELRAYAKALAALTDKVSVTTDGTDPHAPCVQVCLQDGTWTGLGFHGVPGGHEFTSFILGLYNAAGPGQALPADTEARIRALPGCRLQVMVSLSCTMCPELVTAAQRIAALHPGISAEVFDLNHFPALRDTYQVMSVPCLVLDGGTTTFGKKNLDQLTDWLHGQLG